MKQTRSWRATAIRGADCKQGMAAPAETYSLGQEVDLGAIEGQLKRLWAEGEGAMTRASLINLAVYSEQKGSLPDNTALISRLTENHACRAIVIEANGMAQADAVSAWISAHCHVSRAGSKQVCSEQISFLLQGPCTRLLPNMVFSHLDSDLPFYLWWQAELHDPMDPQLWAWVDRFIYDSQTWDGFDAQMRLVETAQAEAKQRLVLCDLNWTRLDKVRIAVAQFFDHPASRHHFGHVEEVAVQFGKGYRSTALLLVGWLAGQLGWKLPDCAGGDTFNAETSTNSRVQITIEENGSQPVNSIRLKATGTEFVVRHAACGDLLEVFRTGANERAIPQMMPAQNDDPVELMSQELLRGGPHQVYLRALSSVRALL
jgi:glucose-6-phosphate dehydrogenase assembly protein OpcA